MGLKHFDRIYFDVYSEEFDEDEFDTYVEPRLHIYYDKDLGSLAVQEGTGDTLNTFDSEELLNGYLADYDGWEMSEPITVPDVVDTFKEMARRGASERRLPYIDSDTSDGLYRCSRPARLFVKAELDEGLTSDDIILIAWEADDPSAWLRKPIDSSYQWVNGEDDTHANIAIGIAADEDDAKAMGEKSGMGYTFDGVGAFVPSHDLLRSLSYAVLSQPDFAHGDWFLDAATATKDQAEAVAERHEGAVIKEIKGGEQNG